MASRSHWAAADAGRTNRVRSSSAALRQYSPERALADVHCQGTAVLRVLNSTPPNAALEVSSGIVHLVDLTSAPVVLVDCPRRQCQQTHRINCAALIKAARKAPPGTPSNLNVKLVSVM